MELNKIMIPICPENLKFQTQVDIKLQITE